MSDKASSCDSSDFSDGYPTTTTISTVAVQAGNARIVLAVLRCGNWIRVRIQRMEPDLYDIGGNADEARSLQEIHEHLCAKLASKQEQISELLSRADDLVTQQTSDNQSQVYAAMAESLNRAWRDLLGILTQRGRLLDLAVECFNSAENVIYQAETVEHLCNTGSWGHDVNSVRRLIEEHENLKRTGLLEPSHNMLNLANNLLELLGRMSCQAGGSTSASNTGSGRASIEARERVAVITSKAGVARRHAEDVWNRRDHLLHLRLAVVSMEAELERIVDWFVKTGEPRFSDIQVGTSLSECQANLDMLMTLADEVRDLQNAHSRLMQHLHQATTTDSWRRKREKSVSEILRAQEQELGLHSLPVSLEGDNEVEMTSVHDSDTWRVTHGAYSELITRLRTTESYIWEFLERIESRRRQLHTSVIYYSEINVLLSQIYQLESDMKKTRDLQQTGLEEIYYNRLTDLEVRVPGLKQTMNELRSSYNEPARLSRLRAQLGVKIQPPAYESELPPAAANSVTSKMREVDEGIERCRDLLNKHRELNIKIQKREETEFRLNDLSMWLSQRIYHSLVEYGRSGTTLEQVADFEDVHRRLERELQSREPELEELRIAISRLSPTAGKSSSQDRLNELTSCWTRYRQIIQLRLELANHFSSLLRRIREDEYQYNLTVQKMHEADRMKLTTTGLDFHPSWIAGPTESPQAAERMRSELNMTTSRLEEQQILIRQFIDHITQRADQDLQITETVHYCQVQLELNNKRLVQLRESWDNCQQLWDQYKLAQEQWEIFTQTARSLDETMTSSLSRMSRTPLPSQPYELTEALKMHHNERNEIDQLTLNLKTKAQQLGAMVGARPDDQDHSGQGWRFVEAVDASYSGLASSNMGKRIRSEMCMQLAGLETRWKAWDKAWTSRSIQLERRGTHFGHLTTIEGIEEEIVMAERKLQEIMGMVSLTAPISQVQMADRALSQIEATVPVLRGRIHSSAPDMRLQLIQGEPSPNEYTGANIDLMDVTRRRHEQLESRLTTFTEETVRCRTEISLTLRLLNAVSMAENVLSQITFNLDNVKSRIAEISLQNTHQIEQIRFEISEQINRGRVLADTHIPVLEQLAFQYPRPVEAKQLIQPLISGFQTTINNLNQMSDEIRVRTEQFIDLQRPQGMQVAGDQIRSTSIVMPVRAKPPVITKPLENITTEEGKKVVMETKFDSGLPPDANPFDANQLQVTWYKDGLPVITPDYEVNLTPNSASLKISETLTEDNAVFSCHISTPYGKAETRCTLTVIEPISPQPADESMIQPTRSVREQKPVRETGEPPQFIKHLKSTYIDETQELVLDCQAVGQPVPFLSWYRNDQLIDQNPDFKITQLAGSGILRVPQCRVASHSGVYVCRAINPLGECSTTCQVNINPAQPPEIIQPLQNLNLKVGDRCKLTVQYKSALPAVVEWYHNDMPIQGEIGRRRITMEVNNTVSLHLLMVSELEGGKYACTVRNPAGFATTSCSVTVHPLEKREPLSPSQLSFRATASRRRRDIQLEFDEVFEPSKIPRVVQSPTAVRAAVPYTSPQDFQRAVSVPPLTTVSVPLRMRTHVPESRPASDYGRPPQFLTPLQNAEVDGQEKIKLECQITGFPAPKVSWLKNGIPLARSNSYAIQENGQYHSLTFYDVFIEDQGEYTCVAENPYGNAFSSCRMDVEPIHTSEQPVDRAPTIVKPLPARLSAVEGNSLDLTCQFTGRPIPTVVWLKDGKQPQSSVNFQTFQDSGFARLYIPKVEKDKGGTYEAVATNQLGSCSTTLYLEIIPTMKTSVDLLTSVSPAMSGSPPEFTRIFKDVYIESERLEEIVLECSVTGIPTPTVYWTHNGIIITPDDQRYTVGRGPGPNDHCLIIRRPGPESAGRYQAIAENIHGRVTCSALISPSGFSQTLIKRPPSTMSLTRHTVIRQQQWTRETSLPPSPASTGPILSPQSFATVQVPRSPIRFQRETSAPPSQYYLTRHHLQIRPRQATPPIQLTFSLPRKEKSLSRTEITKPVESHLRPQGQVKHYSSTQHLNKKQFTPVVQHVETRYSRRVASQPRLSPGYSSEEEHEHSMSIVPMVRHYKTRMERNMVARPHVTSGYTSVKEHRRSLHVIPMRREYQTCLEHNVPSRPTLETCFATEEEREYGMNVVPIVPHTDYKTELTTDVYSKPELTPGYATETKHIRSFEVTPMVPEYHTKMERQVTSHPILEAGYSSEEEHEHKLSVVPMVPYTSYKTELSTDVLSKPELVPGYSTETKHPVNLEVTPMVPEYRTELDTSVASHPYLEEGYTSEGEHERQMELVPLVPEYKTQLSTDLSAKTEVISGYESRLHFERTYLMETQLKQYESAISTRIPSRPSLTSIFESTFEHETNMNVVPVVPHDEHYQSQILADFHAQYRPIDVIVEVPIPPEFVKPLTNVIADEGACVVIEGLVNGVPQPKISWYRSGREICDGPDFRLDYTDNRVRLTLSEAFAEDAGEYMCEAENVAGRAQSAANLIVRARLLAPKFIKGLENQIIYEGESVRLVVKVDGHPPPTVTWTRDGHEITSSPNYILEKEGDGVYALSIPEAFFENSGRYAVIAENPAGKCISSGLVTVLEPERPYPGGLDKLCQSQLTVQVEGLKQVRLPSPVPQPHPEKPYFTKAFSPEIEINEGERLVLTAEAWGNPIPIIKWYFNGQPLVDGPDHQQSQVGPQLTDVNQLQPHPVLMTGHLVMNEVFLQDSGLYTCVAENIAGQAEVMANISVVPKPIREIQRPSIQPPEFVRFPESPVKLQSGQDVVFEVEVKGLPLTSLNWYHNNMIVHNNQNVFIENIPEAGITRLFIKCVQPDDQGEWLVTATNPAGSCSRAVRVICEETVFIQPEPIVHSEYELKLSHPVSDVTDLSYTYEQQTLFIQPEMIPPNFVERFPSEIKINEGTPLILHGRVHGQPKPTIKWLKNGKPLYPSDRIHYYALDDGTVHLEIAEPTEEDSGVYVASAENPVGEDHCIVTLSVLPLVSVAPTGQPPVFCRGPLPWSPAETGPLIVCPGVLNLKEGQSVRLEVEVIGKPTPTIAWFINGRSISMDKTHKVVPLRANVCSLILDSPAPNLDSGLCSCIATNQFGQAELQFNIHVESKPQTISQAPRFVQKPPIQLTASPNEQVTLYAVAEGIPKPVLSWHKDGKLFTGTADGRIQIVTNEMETTLYIASLQPEDFATWQCLAANTSGSASARCKISAPVEEKPKEPARRYSIPKKQPEGLQEVTSPNPIIMSPPQSVRVNEGENARFTAHIVANPPPVVSWYIKGQPVPTVGTIQQQPEGEEIRHLSRFDGLIYYLDMQKCLPEDAGEIYVVAQRSDISPEAVANEPNAVVSASANLEVVPAVDLRAQLKPIPKTSTEIIPEKVEPKLEGRAPRFLKFLQPVTAPESSQITFSVEFDGEPSPEVIWMHEQEDISNKENYQITTTPTTSQLVISNVRLEDMGNFSVTLRNPIGQACSKSRLTVTQLKVSGKAPEFVPPIIQSQVVEAGEPITFECKVIGEPTPQVHWERNGERLPLKSLDHMRIFDAPPFHTLVLCETVPEDSAEYQCVAINAHGHSVCKANVTVKAKPVTVIPPRIIQAPQSVTVAESEPVQLTALIEGTPMPEITWLLHNEVIKPSQYFLPEVRPDGYTILNISNVYPEDVGVYTVRAMNAGGEVTASAEVCLSAPQTIAPQFVKPLPMEPIEVKEGEQVCLEVQVSGEPLPEISWYQNGQPIQSGPVWKVTTDRYISRLECKTVSMNNSGEILVRAVNPAGQTTTQTKMIIIRLGPEPKPPVFEKRLQPRIKVLENHTVTLECCVNGYPEPTLRWFHNGVEFEPVIISSPSQQASAKKELYIDRSTHTYTLSIHDLNAFDIGEIMVRAENELGVTMCSSVLELEIVDGKIVEPRFVRQPPERIELQPGDSARLECEVESEPPVTFRWYLNGLQLDQTAKQFKVLEDTNRTTLIIPSVQPEILPSQVTIEAAGQTGTKIVTSSVLVMMAKTDDITETEPEKQLPELRFTRQLPTHLTYSEKDEAITLEVEVDRPEESFTDVPQPVFSWYLNGIEIFLLPPEKNPERYIVTQDQPWQSRLTINNPGTWDFGEVTCMVTRLSGDKEEKIYTSCNLELTYQPPKTEEQPKAPVVSKLEFAPQFIQGLPEKLTPEVGSTVVMDIILKANPSPDIQWAISSPSTAERFEFFGPEQVDDDTLQYRAVLHNYQPEKDDNTVLQMIATSPLGQATSVCHIQPREQQTVNVQFAKTLTSQLEVALDQPLQLECSVQPTTAPIEFRWYVKGLEVTQEQIPCEVKTTEFSSILEIPKINSEMIGTITVSVLHPEGELTSSCELYTATEVEMPVVEDVITELPSAPETFTVELKNVEEQTEFSFIKPVRAEVHQDSTEERTLELECQLLTDQQPVSVQWSHEGSELTVSDRIEQVYEYESGLAKLVIHNVTPQDMGEYTCTATRTQLVPTQVEPIQKTITSSTVVDIEVPETVEIVPTISEKVLTFLQPVKPNIHTVQDHKDLELECQIQADLKPIQLVWEVNGEELTQSDRTEMTYFEDSGIARLIVHQVVPSDSGEYVCKVHGEVVEAETKQQMTKTISSGSIVTIEDQPEEITVPAEDTQLVQPSIAAVEPADLCFVKPVAHELHKTSDQEKQLELECQFQADLKPVEVQWKLDGKELTQSDRIEMTYMEDVGVAHLTVHQVSPSDSGDYQCVVVGEVIEAKTGERSVKTIMSTSHVTIEEELPEEVTIPLEVSEPKQPVFTTVEPADLYFVKPISQEFREVSGQEKQLELECQFQADLKPVEVQWKLDGKELTQSDRIEMTYMEDVGVAHLTVHQVSPSDSGDYQCVVVGEVIEAKTGERSVKTIMSTSHVTIEEDLPEETVAPIETSEPEQSTVVPVQPADLCFVKPITPQLNIVSEQERQLELECQFQADLKPVDVQWKLDGKELTQSDRIEMTYMEDVGVAHLTVHQVSPSDSGDYQCVVVGEVIEAKTGERSVKTIMSTSHVTIEEVVQEDSLRSPVIINELTPLSISEGEEIYLTAVVKGNPQPTDVTWKHNGNVLQPDSTDAAIFYSPETGVCELTISEAFPEDSGVYSVEAQNNVGTAISQTEVVVLVEVRTQPSVLQEDDIKVVDIINDSVELEKQAVLIDIEQTERTEMYSPIETLPEVLQAAVYEHIAEETEFEVDLEEPLEMDDTEFSLEEGVTPTHAIVLDVLIPHDSISVDETSISVEEAEKAQSIPSLTEISLHDVTQTGISETSLIEFKPVQSQEYIKTETISNIEDKDHVSSEDSVKIQETTPQIVEKVTEEQVGEAEDTLTTTAEDVVVQEGKETVTKSMDWASEGVSEMDESDGAESAVVVEQPSEAAVAVSEKP
ncbi:unnamed protein product, partial [Trichobilharzia szidati]